MSSSLLIGQIPLFIVNMSSLKAIDLSRNNLSGSFLLIMWYNLPVLEELYLSTNQPNGPIPSFIWDCKTLVRLYLAENNFTGGITKRIGNLTLLWVTTI